MLPLPPQSQDYGDHRCHLHAPFHKARFNKGCWRFPRSPQGPAGVVRARFCVRQDLGQAAPPLGTKDSRVLALPPRQTLQEASWNTDSCRAGVPTLRVGKGWSSRAVSIPSAKSRAAAQAFVPLLLRSSSEPRSWSPIYQAPVLGGAAVLRPQCAR